MAYSIAQADCPHLGHSRYPQNNHRNKKHQHPNSSNSSSVSLCDGSHAAAVDIIILILVLGAYGFLVLPYVKFFCHGVSQIVHAAFSIIVEEVSQAPSIYASVIASSLLVSISLWEIIRYMTRKCDNPNCRGLRKSAEFDIQLEPEECIKNSQSASRDDYGGRGLFELGDKHKDLEEDLRKLAPPNGRAVLIFRAKCGCPIGRVEVWGHKKNGKIKK
ncbi:uncharacterized protein At5g19025-like [Nymphaea colorata]|nr:uncharacterized protein At5g19025-like [Nymphaea colorata]